MSLTPRSKKNKFSFFFALFVLSLKKWHILFRERRCFPPFFFLCRRKSKTDNIFKNLLLHDFEITSGSVQDLFPRNPKKKNFTEKSQNTFYSVWSKSAAWNSTSMIKVECVQKPQSSSVIIFPHRLFNFIMSPYCGSRVWLMEAFCGRLSNPGRRCVPVVAFLNLMEF